MSCVCIDPIDDVWYTKIFFHNQCVLPCTNSPHPLIEQTAMWQENRFKYYKAHDFDSHVPFWWRPRGKCVNGVLNLLISFGDYLSVPQGSYVQKTKGLFKGEQLLSKKKERKKIKQSSFHMLAVTKFCKDGWQKHSSFSLAPSILTKEKHCLRLRSGKGIWGNLSVLGHTVPEGSWGLYDYPAFCCPTSAFACKPRFLVADTCSSTNAAASRGKKGLGAFRVPYRCL